MAIASFFNVHQDTLQEGTNGQSFVHNGFFGLEQGAAYAKYHELLSAAYVGSDLWTTVYVMRDDGVMVEGDLIDRRVDPETEPQPEPETEP